MLKLSHSAAQHKLTQHHRSSILQLKKKSLETSNLKNELRKIYGHKTPFKR